MACSGISFFWLGGTDEANEGNWTWTDGSKWSVEHWLFGQGNDGSGQNCLDTTTSGWWDDPCSYNYPPTNRVFLTFLHEKPTFQWSNVFSEAIIPTN